MHFLLNLFLILTHHHFFLVCAHAENLSNMLSPNSQMPNGSQMGPNAMQEMMGNNEEANADGNCSEQPIPSNCQDPSDQASQDESPGMMPGVGGAAGAGNSTEGGGGMNLNEAAAGAAAASSNAQSANPHQPRF
jgi:hypothetical protein